MLLIYDPGEKFNQKLPIFKLLGIDALSIARHDFYERAKMEGPFKVIIYDGESEIKKSDDELSHLKLVLIDDQFHFVQGDQVSSLFSGDEEECTFEICRHYQAFQEKSLEGNEELLRQDSFHLESLEERIRDGKEFDFNGPLSFYLHQIEREIKELDLEGLIVENRLHRLEVPFAYFSPENDLLFFNDSYRKLDILPSDCLDFQPESAYRFEDKLFYLKLEVLEEKEKLYVFLRIDESSSSTKILGNDLGIITSSIAHELNNPIAGILTSTEILLMEDINDQYQQHLIEMKNSVIRCKELIETFLGFSKTTLHSDDQTHQSVEKQVQQAINLNRSRILDNRIVIKLTVNDYGPEKVQIKNASILTMLFYIIFNEAVSLLVRKRLVGSKINTEIDVVISENEVKLLGPWVKDLEVALDRSILVMYLLSYLRASITADENRLVLSLKDE
jgi:signal transduction histidine kinase